MSDQAGNGPAAGGPKRDWAEIVATLLLAPAAVATAWSSYQASRWNGEQAKAAGRTTGIRIQAARAAGLAAAQTQVDVATFVQWVNADSSKDKALADFYRNRFRQEFRPAFTAWMATRPDENPDAPRPRSPCRNTGWPRPRTPSGSTRLPRRRRPWCRPTSSAPPTTCLVVVLFAVALFFAGISTKLQTTVLRRSVLVLGSLLFVATVAWIATFPVSVSI